MRIVCDTNVLVSGLLFGGHCRAIVRLASEGRVEGFTSMALVQELEPVLLRPKFGLTSQQAGAIVELVRSTFPCVSPTEELGVVSEDPDDDAVLEAAIAAHADIIVSGDDHLLALAAFRGIRILSPARFIDETPDQQVPAREP